MREQLSTATLLTVDDYEQFEQELLAQKEIRVELEVKLEELCEYENC